MRQTHHESYAAHTYNRHRFVYAAFPRYHRFEFVFRVAGECGNDCYRCRTFTRCTAFLRSSMVLLRRRGVLDDQLPGLFDGALSQGYRGEIFLVDLDTYLAPVRFFIPYLISPCSADAARCRPTLTHAPTL